ncbi:sensor histidine kinase [Metabacillus fastidiosus]|uniref:sensor histidine kinase n=1 Tax=Metabacillus fastidiosus TaxID=1458 RepID=UPI002E24C582|nr:sensor histidine kinase [Metabacillus fastidiosus]
MEQWLIFSKLTILIYIGLVYTYEDSSNIALFIISFFTYICLNIAIYIIKKSIPQYVIIFLSAILTIIAHFYVEPLFILLFAMNFYEFTTVFLKKKFILYLFSFLPVPFIEDNELRLFYGLAGTLSFTIFFIIEKCTNKFIALELEQDQMRKDIQRLTRSLHENEEYIRQSDYMAKLEERNRLSQEIHDQIGHSMTGALIQMEAAKRMIEIDKEKAAELLQNAIHISSEGIEHIRLTLKNMKPPVEKIGINKMRLFIDEFTVKNEFTTVFLHKGNIDIISPIQWKVMYENITEALTNCLKYSDATFISVEIHVLNKFIKAEVKDNGKGIDKLKKGLGIVGMEERTASLNGKVIIDGSNGFSVTTLLPLDKK